jgi:L-arabinose isomerase
MKEGNDMSGTLKPKVGVLALTLELYETLAPKVRGEREEWVRRAVVPALAKEMRGSWATARTGCATTAATATEGGCATSAAEVMFGGAVNSRAGVDAAVAEMEGAGVDGIVVLLLTYAPSQIALPALKRTRLPILVWNTQELLGVTPGFGGAELTANHGVHGTQDLCNVLLRSGVRFEYVTSHLSDGDATREVGDFARAAAAVRRLRGARLGLLGYPFPGMGDFALDTTLMSATLGCEWMMLPVEEYVTGAARATREETEGLVAEYRRLYEVTPEVKAADLEATARVEISLRRMVSSRRLDGLTYQFLAFGEDARTPTVPFVAASRLMAEGMGFGGEGDLIATAGSAFLNWLSGPASFTEIFTIDFAGNAALMSHMGEANVAMARRDRRVRLSARPGPITRTLAGQLSLAVGFEPGPATLCALTLGPGSRWRLVASAVSVLDFPPVAGLPSPTCKVSPLGGNVREFLTGYAKAGGPHHSAICFGDARARLKLAAGMMGAEYCEV